MDHGISEKKKKNYLEMTLTEQEEAIVQLLRKISHLEHENRELKEEIANLRWTLTETK